MATRRVKAGTYPCLFDVSRPPNRHRSTSTLRRMSVWTLAGNGSHGVLRLGCSEDDVLGSFGQPDDTAVDAKGRLAIMKYDPIELHFFKGQLWLLHCEFGGPPLPVSVACPALNLDPGPLCWPLDETAVLREAKDAALDVDMSTRDGMRELCIGNVTLLLAPIDELSNSQRWTPHCGVQRCEMRSTAARTPVRDTQSSCAQSRTTTRVRMRQSPSRRCHSSR